MFLLKYKYSSFHSSITSFMPNDQTCNKNKHYSNLFMVIFNLILVLCSPKRSYKRQNIVIYWSTWNENCTLSRKHHSFHSFCMHNSNKLIRSFILLLYTHTITCKEKKLSRCSILHIRLWNTIQYNFSYLVAQQEKL